LAARRATPRSSLVTRPPLALTPPSRHPRWPAAPYDLHHAAVSLWLNTGVPGTEVARRASHSIAVLLKVCANCIDGQAGADQRIGDALDEPGSE
jgi:hypothetical protein